MMRARASRSGTSAQGKKSRLLPWPTPCAAMNTWRWYPGRMSSHSDFPIASRARVMKHFAAAVFAVLLGAVPIYAQREAAKATTRNPFSGNQQAVADGRETYNNACTACHGYEGTGGDRAPGLGASGRRYLRTSDQELFDAITKGIPGTSMPPTGLPETSAWKVAAYIVSLRGTAIDAPAPGD